MIRLAPLLPLLALLALAPAPAGAASKRDLGTQRLRADGELAVVSDAGRFLRHRIDPATGAVVRDDELRAMQELFLLLDAELTRNVNERFLIDIDDRFRGAFASPQEAVTGRVSELDNRLRVRFGTAHDERTVSEIGLSAAHVRTRLPALEEEDADRYGGHLLIDRTLGTRTHLAFKAGRESAAFGNNPADDHHRVHTRVKLTRFVDAVGRQPAAFKYFLLESMPETLRAEERYMDLAWDLYVGHDAYEMRNRPAGEDHAELVVGTDLNMFLSEFAQARAGVSVAARAHDTPSVADGILDFRRQRLHLELDQRLTTQLRWILSSDLVTVNRRDAAGFDLNDFRHEARFEYSHRPHIRWDLSFSGDGLSRSLFNAGPPDARDYAAVSEWTRRYGERLSFTQLTEFSRYRVKRGETAAHPASRGLRTTFLWSRLLADDVTLDLGFGADDVNHDRFPAQDREERFLRSAVRVRF